MDGLQINMEADYKGVPSFRAALQLMGCDGQCGGTAHRLQKAQASLLSQQCVHTELTQANRPWEGITWWEKREERLKTKHTHTHKKQFLRAGSTSHSDFDGKTILSLAGQIGYQSFLRINYSNPE